MSHEVLKWLVGSETPGGLAWIAGVAVMVLACFFLVEWGAIWFGSGRNDQPNQEDAMNTTDRWDRFFGLLFYLGAVGLATGVVLAVLVMVWDEHKSPEQRTAETRSEPAMLSVAGQFAYAFGGVERAIGGPRGARLVSDGAALVTAGVHAGDLGGVIVRAQPR